jgi:hypothetical protein
MLELHVDDAGFVRAPARLVYRRLTDVGAWPSWWSGVRVRRLPPVSDDETWMIELVGAPLRRLRVGARLHSWRHSVGFSLELWGELHGQAEFWLEPGHGGTRVHHLLVAQAAPSDAHRLHADYRRAIRRGLWGLKDLVQLEARTSAGLLP